MNFNIEPITITRTAGGGYVNGHHVPGPSTTHSGRANIQPLSGVELLKLPEAERVREHNKVYTAFALKVGDVVERPGCRRYEVQAVDDWSGHRQAHFKARIVRIES